MNKRKRKKEGDHTEDTEQQDLASHSEDVGIPASLRGLILDQA